MVKNYNQMLKDSVTLSRAAELELIVKAKTINEARDTVINSFLKLIASVARPYVKDGITLDDLIPEGIKGLHRAIDDFKPELNKRFATYARWWIKHFIVQYYRANIRGFKLSGNISSKLSQINALWDEMEQILGRPPTKAEIAKETGYDIGYVEYLFKFVNNTISLNQLTEEGDSGNFGHPIDELSLSDNHIDSPYERLARTDSINRVKECLSELPDKERKVLIFRYGLDGGDKLTLKKVASKMKITEEWVRQLQLKAEDKLRQRMYA